MKKKKCLILCTAFSAQSYRFDFFFRLLTDGNGTRRSPCEHKRELAGPDGRDRPLSPWPERSTQPSVSIRRNVNKRSVQPTI